VSKGDAFDSKFQHPLVSLLLIRQSEQKRESAGGTRFNCVSGAAFGLARAAADGTLAGARPPAWGSNDPHERDAIHAPIHITRVLRVLIVQCVPTRAERGAVCGSLSRFIHHFATDLMRERESAHRNNNNKKTPLFCHPPIFSACLVLLFFLKPPLMSLLPACR
jgi:hypothetical protein